MIATVIQEEKLCIKNTCIHLSKLGKKPRNTKNQREINKKMKQWNMKQWKQWNNENNNWNEIINPNLFFKKNQYDR